MPLLCGGNLDMSQLREVLIHAMSERQQLLSLRVRIDDHPGVMEEISGIIASQGANIHDVRHERSVDDLEIGEAYLVFNVETSGSEHAQAIIEAVRAADYAVENTIRSLT